MKETTSNEIGKMTQNSDVSLETNKKISYTTRQQESTVRVCKLPYSSQSGLGINVTHGNKRQQNLRTTHPSLAT